MALTRRAVLGAGTAAVGGLLLGLPAVAVSASPTRATGLRRAAFTPHVGRELVFEADGSGQRAAIVIASVEDLRHAAPSDAQRCFSVICSARDGDVPGTTGRLRAGSRTVADGVLLLPVDRAGATQRYQLLVNNPS